MPKNILAMTIKLMNGRQRQWEAPGGPWSPDQLNLSNIQFGALRTSRRPPRPASAVCHEMREFQILW